MANMNAWHMMDTEQICSKLETNAVKGLGKKQAVARAKKIAVRQPEALSPLFLPTKQPFYRDLLKLLLDPVMLLTLFVAILAFLFKEYALGSAVSVILLIGTLCCAIANYRARKVANHLQLYSNPMIKVIRSGKLYTTDARNVLPGDLIILTEGDICPADVRLDKGCSARVLQYQLGESGISQISVIKSGDVLYTADQDVFCPNYENIVYAGSVIESGFIRGIVVETGLHTYIGASNGIVPGTVNSSAVPQSIAFIKRYFSTVSVVQAILILPLTFLMAATLHHTLSFAECFLTALALGCTVLVGHVISHMRFVRAAGIDAAASEKQNAAVAIIKNSKAADQLCEMTDLFLFDTAAITDGKYHLESVYAYGSIYNMNELLNLDVHRLATDLHLYRTASRPPQLSGRDAFDAGLTAPIDALIKHVSIDTGAAELTRISSYVSMNGEIFTVHNQRNDGTAHDVLLSSSESLFACCTHVATSEDPKEIDDGELNALRTLFRIYKETGYRLLLVANRQNGCTVLTGVLAFAHRTGRAFAECCEQLQSSGVRISVFMPENAENMKILTDCELVRDPDNDVLTASAARDQGLDLHAAYGSYRAYIGFSESQISELIEKLKQRGNRIASYCVDSQFRHLHQATDLTITCDAIEYRSAKVAESYYEKMPVDGKSFSSRASQHMRRESDIVLRRACELGGGLHGILTGRKFAFSINHNLANAVTYLITMQFFRIVLLVVPAMFGTHMLSALSILISGMILDTAAVILFGFVTPNQNAVASAYPIMRRLEKPITYNAANVISACVSALLVWLAFVLLQIFGVMDATQSAGLGFVSTYLLQGLVFAITLKEYAERSKKKFSLAKFAIIFGYLFLLIACVCAPGFNVLTGCNAMTWLAALLAPLASLFYIVTYRILSTHGLNLHK